MRSALLAAAMTVSFAFPALATTFDLRAPEIEDIDEVASFQLTRDGITATVSANVGVLNRTTSAFGINIVGTSCGGQEESDQIDDGCSVLLNLDDEAVSVAFDRDVILQSLKVSSFGSSDEGVVDIEGDGRSRS